MKNKKGNNIIIISAIISFVIGIAFLIYFLNYYNIKLTIIISIVIAFFIIVPILCIPYRIAENKKQLVDELFLIDITNKCNNDEHIRITEKNMLFKYKSAIKYYYIFPKLFSNISLKGKLWETPTYDIFNKTQLSDNEITNIIEKLNKLNNSIDGDIIVNYKGDKKIVNSNEINRIFKSYEIKF